MVLLEFDMPKNNWLEFPKPALEQKHNVKQFKTLDDFRKSRQARIDNARNSNISAGAKVIYLKGKAKLCNAEKLLQRGNRMTGYKIRA